MVLNRDSKKRKFIAITATAIGVVELVILFAVPDAPGWLLPAGIILAFLGGFSLVRVMRERNDEKDSRWPVQ